MISDQLTRSTEKMTDFRPRDKRVFGPGLTIPHSSCLNTLTYSKSFALLLQITNLKKALKTQAADTDEAMATDSREAHSGTENRKKSNKSKTAKGTGKWSLKQLI